MQIIRPCRAFCHSTHGSAGRIFTTHTRFRSPQISPSDGLSRCTSVCGHPKKAACRSSAPTEHRSPQINAFCCFLTPSNPRTKRCSLEKASLSLVSALLTQRKLSCVLFAWRFCAFVARSQIRKDLHPHPNIGLCTTSAFRNIVSTRSLALALGGDLFSACS